MNAQEVLNQVELLLDRAGGYRIHDVCDELSIFDWWNDTLSKSQLQAMRAFLRRAIKEGFTGYVCFKVGAKGCASGMWAHTAESTSGYSPDEGDVLYRSFQSGENYWVVKTQGTDFCNPVDTGSEVAKLYKQLKENKDRLGL